MNNSRNIDWIDNLKSISMISVYLLHSEIYVNHHGISYGYWLTPFYVNAFFFISGYLFFNKFNQKSNFTNVDLIVKVKKLLALIVWPTIVFSSIIYVPKIFFHKSILSFQNYFFDVFGGVSFWFTSSLFVAQLILCLLFFLKIKNIFYHFMIASLFFVAIIIFKNFDPSPFPWYYKSGLGAIFFLVLGGLYLTFEHTLFVSLKRNLRLLYFSIILIFYIFLMFNDIDSLEAKREIIIMNFNLYGLIESLLGIIVIVYISKIITRNKILNFISKNSILFYFFSGALPAFFGKLLNVFYLENPGYWAVSITVILSLFTCSYLIIFINKYFPFLTDFRKINF